VPSGAVRELGKHQPKLLVASRVDEPSIRSNVVRAHGLDSRVNARSDPSKHGPEPVTVDGALETQTRRAAAGPSATRFDATDVVLLEAAVDAADRSPASSE
jgi:hypothetical protein